MTPTLTNRHGDKDGIRWGDLRFPLHGSRRFTHDLIGGKVRLYHHPKTNDFGGNSRFAEDVDPERVAAALRVLTA